MESLVCKSELVPNLVTTTYYRSPSLRIHLLTDVDHIVWPYPLATLSEAVSVLIHGTRCGNLTAGQTDLVVSVGTIYLLAHAIAQSPSSLPSTSTNHHSTLRKTTACLPGLLPPYGRSSRDFGRTTLSHKGDRRTPFQVRRFQPLHPYDVRGGIGAFGATTEMVLERGAMGSAREWASWFTYVATA
ncbi:uncharacterized protein LACBIDRAFT_329766 [Laccaria bicolor S238N-H82]|uniref:Predicted protein n=1 Tax=Laccaria bicolor (strain S238N-H82 / ATCC MYA-4686) TaxID=486041 RepID=B0DJ58_LACBS|nr:uncharacterized protein LACBIDRAFT_329766 [Laccaria bicolor S238N-H82]EDR05347.1 predicted protein [Laccaria bicolor S238N-H82]|eukprot:XP_001883905.1 predicted protein [Laccaria bicolor S238N-H82]